MSTRFVPMDDMCCYCYIYMCADADDVRDVSDVSIEDECMQECYVWGMVWYDARMQCAEKMPMQ